MSDELAERKKKIFKKLIVNKSLLVYLVLALIMVLGFYIRTRNLDLLKDSVTGQYIPADPDAFAVLRYAKFISENGFLMQTDFMRYYPFGFDNVIGEFSFLSHFVVFLHKFLSIFSPSITLNYVDVLYPPIVFTISLVFFFLLVRKLFDYRIALLATAFLALLPSYLFRTISGVSDKEALAMLFFFMAIYFYVYGMSTTKVYSSLAFGILSGIFTGFTGYIWGGVSFLFLIIGGFNVLKILLDKFNSNDFYLYSGWFFLTIITLTNFVGKFPLKDLVFSINFTSSIMVLAFLMAVIYFVVFKLDLLRFKGRIEQKISKGLAVFLISSLLASLFAIISFGIGPILDIAKLLVSQLVFPFTSRWAATVAESHQPYITDWINQMGWKYTLFFLIGSVVLFYETVKGHWKKTRMLVTAYSALLFMLVFSRYSAGSTLLNGQTAIARIMFFLSLVGLFVPIVLFYIYSFYHKKDNLEKIRSLNDKYIFVFIWLILMIIAGRTASRLIFVFAPITTILASYLLWNLFDYSFNLKKDGYKIVVYIALILVLFAPLSIASSLHLPSGGIAGAIIYDSLDKGTIVNFYTRVKDMAEHTGLGYNRQWQQSMAWVRDNTPEDSIFAHWWDYGYFVQYGGERTTLSDGGNALGAINQFIGRHVLTAQSEREALEFLKARNVTHLLIISDEIGKYTAFSSIGSDIDYDRYSWIYTFTLDPSRTQETRNSTIFFYAGGTLLDDDVIYKGQLFPAGSAVIGGIFLPLSRSDSEDGELPGLKLEQPVAAVVYNRQQTNIPLKCLYFGNSLMTYEEGIDGCFRILPVIESNNKANPIGAGLYLSPDVTKSLFAQLYLLNKDSKYFKLVYSDEKDGVPLAIFSGRLIGPIKIWEISYPNNLVIPEEYYGTTLPDPRVELIGRGYG